MNSIQRHYYSVCTEIFGDTHEWKEVCLVLVQFIEKPYFILEEIRKRSTSVKNLRQRPDLEERNYTDPEKIKSTINVDEWHNIPGTTFNVRGKNYAATGIKVPSINALYRVEDCVMFHCKEAVLDPRSMLSIPSSEHHPKECKLPEYLVMNVGTPYYAPGWSDIQKGPTTMCLAICRIAPECMQRWVDGKTNEADRLLRRFLYEPEPPVGDRCLHRRLKIVVRMANLPDLGFFLGNIVRPWNGKPKLLRDSTSFVHGPNYTVATIDCNLFGQPAKNGLWQCKNYTKIAVNDCCVMIEGEGDDNSELPEAVWAAFRTAKFSLFPDV